MTAGRKLRKSDIGKAFVRVDPERERGKYLYLKNLGGAPPPAASFVTFYVTKGAAREVGEMGYFNGPWYEEVHDFSDQFLVDVLGRYEQHVDERLRQLKEDAVAEEDRNTQLRARLGKPESWISFGDGPTKGKASKEYVVWFDPAGFKYSVEVYGLDNQLLASQSVECSHEPRFGIDAFDSDSIFGSSGALAQLIAQVEKNPTV